MQGSQGLQPIFVVEVVVATERAFRLTVVCRLPIHELFENNSMRHDELQLVAVHPAERLVLVAAAPCDVFGVHTDFCSHLRVVRLNVDVVAAFCVSNRNPRRNVHIIRQSRHNRVGHLSFSCLVFCTLQSVVLPLRYGTLHESVPRCVTCLSDFA